MGESARPAFPLHRLFRFVVCLIFIACQASFMVTAEAQWWRWWRPKPPIPVEGGSGLEAASCERTDVAAAIIAAPNNGEVIIPAGECTWSDVVTFAWQNKNLTVRGSGIDVTIINCTACFYYQSSNATNIFSDFRIAHLTLQTTGDPATMITLHDAYGTGHCCWRIDHIKFVAVTTGSGTGIAINGPTYGVIDHNQWTWRAGLAVSCASTRNTESPASTSNPRGGTLAAQPLDMGTANAVYIEDNTFTSAAAGGFAAYDTSAGGCRAVFRYNTLVGSYYYSHWTRSLEIGGILHEVYNNSFTGNAHYSDTPIRLEAGTGAIFNNQVTAFGGSQSVVIDERRGFGLESSASFLACDGSNAWDGNAGDPAAPGWPCLGQIGRRPGKTMAAIIAGDKQDSEPLYLWNNGEESGCRTGGTCTNTIGAFVYDGTAMAQAYVRATAHPNGDVDYVENGSTPKPGYASYTYPHPRTQE